MKTEQQQELGLAVRTLIYVALVCGGITLAAVIVGANVAAALFGGGTFGLLLIAGVLHLSG